MPEPAISIRGLRKSYGDHEAVRGIDLEVQPGEIFAFLGPNGAGKTTTVEILEGYRQRSGGEVTVLGEDPQRAGRAWRERIGIVLQSGRLDPYLTVREALALYAGYYRAPRPVDEVIALVGLEDKADVRTRKLSGGQQRRLDVGMALVGDPELLFLDEPTTGFDPSARRQAWDVIAGLRDLGKTVFLTTHYMDEAQRLADRVTIIADGEIVARGTPADLGDRGSQPATIRYREGGREVSVETTTVAATLHELTGQALAAGRELEGLEVTRPSLEDVYLKLTTPEQGEAETEAEPAQAESEAAETEGARS
ncbi:MAG TPA: ABC transporter ATP-binding protein [Solirubrobacterales bacterium]|nr:ABC transporter ATP-binding protein [Solirubrobacterales bacterium]